MPDGDSGIKKSRYNPFSGTKIRASGGRAALRGFFRIMPLQRWSMGHIQGVLEYVAAHPESCGFPQSPTCVVNTAYFLPSSRSRLTGVNVFGTERGCRSIIIPSSCNGEALDRMDVKMLEPLFRWNPGTTYVYLSFECQGAAVELAAQLSKLKSLTDLTLEGWDDPVAIHRVLMACPKVELLDCFAIEDTKRDWQNERAVQALSTLIEMHPKLKGVCATRDYLHDWYATTKDSRCKHNIALLPFGCDFVLLWYGLWAAAVWCVAWMLACAFDQYILLQQLELSESIRKGCKFLALISVFGSVIVSDMIFTPRYGKSWTRIARYYILFRRFVILKRRTHTTAVSTHRATDKAKSHLTTSH